MSKAVRPPIPAVSDSQRVTNHRSLVRYFTKVCSSGVMRLAVT
jgi:hypothetical protein